MTDSKWRLSDPAPTSIFFQELITSHVAARLNGYVGGYGRPSSFAEEAPKLGLNQKMEEYVKKELQRNHRGMS